MFEAGGFKGARRAPLASGAASVASQPPAGSCTERAAYHNVKRREMNGNANLLKKSIAGFWSLGFIFSKSPLLHCK